MAICLLGLGSNLGDRVGNLLEALRLLRRQVKVLRASALHESLPVGGPPQQPNYFNGAAVVATELPPAALLAVLHDVESQLGRERAEPWGPRTIDLDLLLYDQQVIHSPGLTIPHPRMHERRFVLAPAAEIAGDLRHPLVECSIDELLARLPSLAPGEPKLRVFASIGGMQSEALRWRRLARRVGLVPTMGALHAGHLSLVQVARERSDIVVATIFVNPTQFGPSEDLAQYPRTLDADLAALSAAGCDAVFVPSKEEMYPADSSTFVEPPAVSQPLEGVHRPGHFRGVATVVLKLFQIIPADIACFGQKDYQQAQVIRRMAADFNLPIDIVVCPIIREPDGLAMSSRNRYLSAAHRQQAVALSLALDEAERLVATGERNSDPILAAMGNKLRWAGIERIDYVALADPESLLPVDQIEGRAVALIACYVGETRLIDNRLLGPDSWRA